jgi:hypothetical protein
MRVKSPRESLELALAPAMSGAPNNAGFVREQRDEAAPFAMIVCVCIRAGKK